MTSVVPFDLQICVFIIITSIVMRIFESDC